MSRGFCFWRLLGWEADWQQPGTYVLDTDLANMYAKLLADGFGYCGRRHRVGLNLKIVVHAFMHAVKLPSCQTQQSVPTLLLSNFERL